MKKNITINLFGTLYAIDEDACQLLEQYTENMRSYFAKQEGGDEIIDDIEHRIAELLWENKQQGQQAVDIQTIKNIINKIGDVEQMGNAEDKSDNETNTNSRHEQTLNDGPVTEEANTTNGHTTDSNYNKQENASRKLYRNGNDKMLGGVLSGLAQYSGGKDPLPWRIGFVILAIACFFIFKPFHPFGQAINMMNMVMPGDPFGNEMMPNMIGMMQDMTSSMLSPYNFILRLLRFLPIILYICLWAFVPEAKTVEDRLKMQGKRVDPNNIKKEVISEHEKMSQPAPQNQGCANGCLSIFVLLGKIIGIGCAGCLGIIVVLAILAGIFGWSIHKAHWSISNLPGFVMENTHFTSCGAPNITTDIDLNNKIFNEVEFEGVGNLRIIQGDTFRLVADGDSCYVSNLQVHVDGDRLYIDDSKYNDKGENIIHSKVTFCVTAPAFEYIRHRGLGNIEMPDSIKQNSDMFIEFDGVGSAEIAYVACSTLNLNRSGVGDVRMRVGTKELNINTDGVGNVYLGGHTDVYNEKSASEFISNVYRDELTVGQ